MNRASSYFQGLDETRRTDINKPNRTTVTNSN